MTIEAFSDWSYPKPTVERFRACKEMPKLTILSETWQQVSSGSLDELYGQLLPQDIWLWLLPAMLLCCEEEDAIGKHPISLGLPPMQELPFDREVISTKSLLELLSASQIAAICAYTEMWSWLRQRDTYSHWESFWKSIFFNQLDQDMRS